MFDNDYDYMNDLKSEDFSEYEDISTVELRYWQIQAKKFFYEHNNTAIFEVTTGAGKCLAPGTEVIMFDGSFKKVEDVVVGDKLMGDDSTPRVVTSLASGEEMMYDVEQLNGDTYTVNESHILSLKGTNAYTHKKYKNGTENFIPRRIANKCIDIPLKEYLESSKTIKHILKGYKVGVNFKSQPVNIDPYWLGLWLGDGNKHNTVITAADREIQDYIKQYAEILNMKYSVIVDKRNSNSNGYNIKNKYSHLTNKLKDYLNDYNLLFNKHIPNKYKINSREVRLKLLAGLIDSDGYLYHNYYEIVLSDKKLSDDIVFLARSLGFRVNQRERITRIKKTNFKGVAYRISISGDVDEIPCLLERKKATKRKQKKDVLVCGIKIKKVGVGKYYGFTLSGNNRRFLLKDFTVTHNTFCAIDILQELMEKEPNMKTLIVVPKNIILETGWYKELVDAGIPIQKIGVYYGDVKEYAQITITNMQSINKIPLEIFDMMILDEVHNYGTDRMLNIIKTPMKYKLGLSATLKRMDNKHFDIMKIFNYNIYSYKPSEALTDGVLNPFIFVNVGVQLDIESRDKYDFLTTQLNTIFKTGGSYEKIMRTTSPLKFKMLALINERKALVNNYPEKFNIAREIIAHHPDNKIIVFNQFNDQTSKLYWYLLDDHKECRILHSGISKDKREQALTDFKNDKFNVLLTSKVLDEGYNLPKLDVAIIMAGDSTDKQTVQRMGRVLRKKKGQNSILYQIYCVDTMEERNAETRAKMFKKLSSDYRDLIYMGPNSLNL